MSLPLSCQKVYGSAILDRADISGREVRRSPRKGRYSIKNTPSVKINGDNNKDGDNNSNGDNNRNGDNNKNGENNNNNGDR